MFLSLCCMFYWSHFNLTTLWSSCSHLCFINEARGAWRGSEACLRSHRYCGALTHAHLCAVWDHAHSLRMPPSLSCTLSKDAMPTLTSHICRMEPSNHTGIDNLPCLQHGVFYSQWYFQVGKKLWALCRISSLSLYLSVSDCLSFFVCLFLSNLSPSIPLSLPVCVYSIALIFLYWSPLWHLASILVPKGLSVKSDELYIVIWVTCSIYSMLYDKV